MLIERRRPGHGDGSIGGIFENKLANLNRDFSNAKFPQEMRGKIVGHGFEKFGRSFGNENLRVLAENGVIDGAGNSVLNVAEVARRPQRNIKNEPLAPAA